MRRWIAIAVVAPWAAWAIGRTLGLDRVHPLIAFAAFTPYAALTAPIAVVVAAALRRWAAALAAVAATVLLAVAVLPRATGSESLDSGSRVVTVMTSNLYGGQGDPERIVELVRRHDVDVLCLEEVTPEALDRLDEAGVDATLRHQAAEPGQGATGNAILTREPLRRVPAWEEPPTEPAVDIDLPGQGPPLRVRVVHPYPPIRRASARAWKERLRALPSAPRTPAVIAGDFNATLDHRAFRQVLDRGWHDAAAEAGEGLRPTWPVGRRLLGLTIDHVLASPQLAVGAVHVEDVPGSDHRAVIAELGLPRS